jgi:hypothetical protein
MNNFLQYNNIDQIEHLDSINDKIDYLEIDRSDPELSWNFAVLLIAIILFFILLYFHNKSININKCNELFSSIEPLSGTIDKNSLLHI